MGYDRLRSSKRRYPKPRSGLHSWTLGQPWPVVLHEVDIRITKSQESRRSTILGATHETAKSSRPQPAQLYETAASVM